MVDEGGFMNPRHSDNLLSKFEPKIFPKANSEGTVQWFILFGIKEDEEFGPFHSEAEAEKALPAVKEELKEIFENVMIRAGQKYR